MEQFRHIGEVVGSLKALMVLRDEIQINQRQCCLILDIFSLAMDTIAEEIRQNLKLKERNTKWKSLEFPLRELCKVFKEGELYIRQCLDSKDWLGNAITLSHNRDCVEFHIHNLLCYFPAAIEAIESAGQISGSDPDEKEKKKLMLARKYHIEWNDPKLFHWRFGKQYLVPREICNQLDHAWREDRWRLIESIKDKTQLIAFTKTEQRLADMLLNKLLNGSDIGPIAALIGSKDYQVRRRLGRGRELKEIQWLGQTFALRHFQAHEADLSTLLSLSHPNILQYLCCFYEQEKNEFSTVMELMNKDLWTYMKENCGPRRQILFSVPVVADLMLQIARGMEYLHSKNIYHGHLNPCNILLKARKFQEGYFQAKVSGFGFSSVNNNSDANEDHNSLTWYAPEVLTELEQRGNVYVYASASTSTSTSTLEKADAYSFGMICFQLLTGKVPFEDHHLQGDRTSQNIKAGERPLFPYHSPKYLVSLIKKCWQTDPAQRPTFSSICRILRYTKKFLAMGTESHVINPELNQLDLQAPPVDCCDIETMFLKSFSLKMASTVSQIPYEMFAYKVAEKQKINQSNTKDKPSACGSESDDPNASIVEEDSFPLLTYQTSLGADAQSDCLEASSSRNTVRIKKPTHVKAKKEQGRSKLQQTKSLPSSLSNGVLRTSKVNSNNQSSLTLAQSTLIPGRRRPPMVSESERNSKGNDSKPKQKKRVTDSLKMKKSQVTSNPTTLRRAKTETNLKVLGPTHTPRRHSGHVSSDLDSGLGLKMTIRRGRLLSPSSPYPFARTKKSRSHVSDSDSRFLNKTASLSPFAFSPLSPHVRTTCGHVSD